MEIVQELVPSFLVLFFVACVLKLLGRSSTSGGGGGGRLPPGPWPLPVIGSIHKLGLSNPHISLAKLAETYGPVMSITLGHATTVVVSSPDAAREVLQKKDAVLSDRSVPEAFRASGVDTFAFLPPGPHWRMLRRICSSEIFTPQRLDANAQLRRRKVRDLVAFVSECGDSGAAVDIVAMASATTLNLLWNTFFSVDFADLRLNGGGSQEFMDLMHASMEESAGPNLPEFYPWLRAFDPQGRGRRIASINKKVHAVIDRYISPRLSPQPEQANGASPPTGNDFLQTLLGLPNLDLQTIKTLFFELAAAGSDSSSNTVEWAMAELIRWPEAMEKACTEVREAMGDKEEVDEEDIFRLPYLQAVVKETLRLHPPAPLLLPRKAMAAVELGGYTVPEGMRVLVNAWAIGRDASVWTDPEKFFPERFMGGDGGGNWEADFRGGDFTLVQFGGGRRICPGLPLAFRMVHLILASLIHRFDWRLPEGKKPAELDMTESFRILMSMATPLRAIPVPIAAAKP